MLRASASVFALILLGSCATTSEPTKRDIVRIANAEARRRGYDLTTYKQPQLSYNFPTYNDTWRVAYERKRPTKKRAGNHIEVVIDGTTGRVWGLLDPDDSSPVIRLPAGAHFENGP